MKHTKLLIYLIACLLAINWSQRASASEVIELEAAMGSFKFPFFETETPVWHYNSQIPGPLIRAQQGSTLSVNLTNSLDEPTTIHWHGLRIDNAMDGVPGVTQDPIQPGDSFTYDLELSEAGTFWYHPHFNNSEQLERGLKGVLIVDEKEQQP